MPGRSKITEKTPPTRSDCHVGSLLRVKTECQDGPVSAGLAFFRGRKLLLPEAEVTMYKVMVSDFAGIPCSWRLACALPLGAAAIEKA